MAKQNTSITGACGEHYIAAYLSGNGLIVAMPRGGMPGCDLLVAKLKGGCALRVQVKTGRESKRYSRYCGEEIYVWFTSWAAIERDDKNLWYAFIWLNDWPKSENLPEVFIIPSKTVVSCMKTLRKEEATRPHYWMPISEAQNFKGRVGLNLLLDALDS